jgi:hypothetical protein
VFFLNQRGISVASLGVGSLGTWLAPAKCGALALLMALLVSGPARAQAENQAAARSLFEEARSLVKAGNYAAACPKFEAANRLYTSPGALLNLGDCHEQLGLTASAWTEFGEAATVATRAGRGETAEEARRRQRAVQPRLMRVVIKVAHPVDGMLVERDGASIAEAAWGASLPVDPGNHRLEARAPGHEPWTATFELTKPGQTVTVEVPALTALPQPSEAVAAGAGGPGGITEAGGGAAVDLSPSRDEATSPSHTLQWVLIGGGAALTVGAGALMLVQSNRASNSREQDDPELYDSTKTPWAIGLTGVIVGVLSAAGGTAWLFRARAEESRTALVAAPWLTEHAVGLGTRGTW